MKIFEWQQPIFYEFCLFLQFLENSLFGFQSWNNNMRKTIISKKIHALRKLSQKYLAGVKVEFELIR